MVTLKLFYMRSEEGFGALKLFVLSVDSQKKIPLFHVF